MYKIHLLYAILIAQAMVVNAQLPIPFLVGYWQNWSDVNAPYIQLSAIDNRYNVIEIAFAVPASTTDMTMTFTPDVVTKTDFINKVQGLQSQGKKVLISVGGANATIDLTTTANKNAFITSMGALINEFGFDGLDIDIEHGNSILITTGTITGPANMAQLNLIAAIKQIMDNYRTAKSKKLLLTITPETAYVQGGQSAFGGIWGGYLPIIYALKDSLDLLQVQLYNSGSMYGIDGKIYTQGNADFILAMSEAAIRGFNTTGGLFSGIPETKIAIGLPACVNAAGGGFVDSVNVSTAINYLRGKGTKPGTYVVSSIIGYPGIKGMMTWSINWDAVNTCGGKYQYANIYEGLFGNNVGIASEQEKLSIEVYPNPTTGKLTIEQPYGFAEISIKSLEGTLLFNTQTTERISNLELCQKGIFFVYIRTKSITIVKKLIVN